MAGRCGSSCRTSTAGKVPNGLGPLTISDTPIAASGNSGVIISPVTYGVKSAIRIRSEVASELVMEQLGRGVLLGGRVSSAADELHRVHRGEDHGSAEQHSRGQGLAAERLSLIHISEPTR